MYFFFFLFFFYFLIYLFFFFWFFFFIILLFYYLFIFLIFFIYLFICFLFYFIFNVKHFFSGSFYELNDSIGFDTNFHQSHSVPQVASRVIVSICATRLGLASPSRITKSGWHGNGRQVI